MCAGVISAIEPYGVGLVAPEVMELAGDEVLLPGLVDTHVHVDEPGRTDWEGFASATRAAAAGGVTTLVDMPLNSIPPTVDVEALQVKRKTAARQCHIDVGFWGGAVPGNLRELRRLHDDGVCGFKCFPLPSGVDEFPALAPDEMAVAMAEIAAFDGLILVHAEDAAVIDEAPAAHGPAYDDFLRSRPRAAENLAIARVVELARQTGVRAHIVHLSSSDALSMIARARREGVRLTVETCPHYLALAADDVPAGHTEFKCCPPIRERANRELLWGGLADGSIDCVVSDHSPCPLELKRLDTGDFGDAWGGVSSLQLGLSIVWTQARRRGFDLDDVVHWMAARPAEIAGLRAKGRLAVGYAADLSVFAPDDSFVVDAARLHHKHPITPYAGQTLSGVVRRTLLRGTEVTGNRPAGRLLIRGEA